MLATSLHLLVGLLGLSLLYAALFLHENEEGQLQNRLEKLWVAVDDLSKTALSKQTAFLQQVSAMANSALNKLFGKRLFSAGAVSASMCFSFGSALLFPLLQWEIVDRRIFPSLIFPKFLLPFLAAAIFSFLVGLLPIPFRYLGFLWIFGVIFYAAYVDRRLVSQEGWKAWMAEEFLLFFAIIVGGFLSDVLFIALSRWCLRRSSELKSGWKIASLVTLNGTIGLVLISPILIRAILNGVKGIDVENSGYKALVLLGASNLVTGAISLLFVVLAIAALAHLAAWPVLERPIYSLQRYGLIRQPKLLAAASVTCLLFAWPNSPIILGITKLIHGG
jgi:hypothetical protein